MGGSILLGGPGQLAITLAEKLRRGSVCCSDVKLDVLQPEITMHGLPRQVLGLAVQTINTHLSLSQGRLVLAYLDTEAVAIALRVRHEFQQADFPRLDGKGAIRGLRNLCLAVVGAPAEPFRGTGFSDQLDGSPLGQLARNSP